MTAPRDLFSTSVDSPVLGALQPFDLARAEGELKLRVPEILRNVQELEAAQEVTQELLEATVRL